MISGDDQKDSGMENKIHRWTQKLKENRAFKKVSRTSNSFLPAYVCTQLLSDVVFRGKQEKVRLFERLSIFF